MLDKVPKSAGKRPQPKGGSRKGKPNKATAAIKDMIDQALRKAGGVDYLLKQSKENPTAFMGLVGKILPKDITVGGPGGGSITIEVIKKIVDPKRDP